MSVVNKNATIVDCARCIFSTSHIVEEIVDAGSQLGSGDVLAQRCIHVGLSQGVAGRPALDRQLDLDITSDDRHGLSLRSPLSIYLNESGDALPHPHHEERDQVVGQRWRGVGMAMSATSSQRGGRKSVSVASSTSSNRS